MKRNFTSLLILFFAVVTGYAYAEEDSNKQQMLIEKLSLTPEQVEPVQSILNEQIAKRKEIMQQMKSDMEAVHTETSQRLGQVLTAEQLQQFEQLHAQRKKKMKQRREQWRQRVKQQKHKNQQQENG